MAKLFSEIAPRFADRNGGYLRIIQTRQRVNDRAPMAIIEFIDYEDIKPKTAKEAKEDKKADEKKVEEKKAEAKKPVEKKAADKPKKEAKKAVELWLTTHFSNDERHIRRIKKIEKISRQIKNNFDLL